VWKLVVVLKAMQEMVNKILSSYLIYLPGLSAGLIFVVWNM